MEMKRSVLAWAALWVLAAAGRGEAQETFRLPASDAAIYNLAGRATLVAGTGSEVVVRVTMRGDDAERLRVEVDEIGGRQTLRVLYPSDEVVYPELGRRSSTQVRVRADGTFGDRGERVRIRGSGGGLEAWADLVVEVPRGSDLAFYVGAGEVDASGIDGRLRIDTGTGGVEAEDLAGALIVDTGSGSVTVSRMRGDVNVDTGSGSVRFEDVDGSTVLADTGSGEVTGRGIRAGSVEVDTGSGDIELWGVAAPDLVLDTGSGSVEVELLQDIERLEVDTGSGSVTVRAPADLGARLEIDSGSGGIDVDFAVEVRSVRRDHMVGTVGDGRGTIQIDTGSGSIRLLRN